MASISDIRSRFKMEFVATLVSTLLGALLVVLLARLLDPDGYGLLYLTLAVIGVAKMFAKLGIGRSSARYITEYKKKDESQIPHILLFSFKITVSLLIIVSSVIIGGHKLIADLIGEPAVAPFLLIGASFIIFETLLDFARSVFQGFEAIKTAAIFSIIKTVGKFVFALGLVVLGLGALGALAGYVIGAAIAATGGILLIYFRYYRSIPKSEDVEAELRRRIAEYAVPLTASEAAGTLSGRIDTVLIGFFLNPVAVSYYVVSTQIVSMIQSPVNALGFSLTPTFGAEKSAGNLDTAAHIYEESFVHIMLLYIPAAAGIILIAEPLIEVVFGANYLGATPVLQVLGIYAIIQANLLISPGALDFIGRARSRAIVKGVTSVMNFGLNILLIPIFGVVGAAFATVFTSGIYATFNMYILHSEFHFNVIYLGKKISQIVIVTLIMVMVVFFLLDYIRGWGTLTAVVLVGITIWALLSIVIGLLDPKKAIEALSW